MEQESLPEGLKDRPWDSKRGVPVPYFNEMEDGSVNFKAIDAQKVYDCGIKELCGACAQPLGYWIAFLGGPLSANSRMYQDGPMHVACAEAGIRYCPHIRLKHHKRAEAEEGSWVPDEADLNKPEKWIISITRGYDILRHKQGFLFKANKVVRQQVYSYDSEGNIQQEGASDV